jgi:uncharacterized membrane protein
MWVGAEGQGEAVMWVVFYLPGVIIGMAFVTRYMQKEFEEETPDPLTWFIGFMGGLLWPILFVALLFMLPARWLIRRFAVNQ